MIYICKLHSDGAHEVKQLNMRNLHMEVLENDMFILKEKSLFIDTLPPSPPVIFIKVGIKFSKIIVWNFTFWKSKMGTFFNLTALELCKNGSLSPAKHIGF